MASVSAAPTSLVDAKSKAPAGTQAQPQAGSLLAPVPASAEDVTHLFAVTKANGFLPLLAPMRKLPEAFAPLEHVLSQLSTLLASPEPRALEAAVAAMPALAIPADAPPALLQSLMRDYSILVSALLLEGKAKAGAPRGVVPANIAVPFTAVASRLQEQWIMSYDSYCLTNCVTVLPGAELAAGHGGVMSYVSSDPKWHWENLRLIRAFDGGAEEYTFIAAHFEIESSTPLLVSAYDGIVAGLRADSVAAVASGLTELKQVMDRILVSQLKMFNASDPKNYEKFVRPWIFGWKGNADFEGGVVFEGTDTPATHLRGETGAQSTIIPTMDIMLGISHKADELRKMLQELEAYRPKPHRDFLAALRVVMWGADVGAGGGEDNISASGGAAPHLLRNFVRAKGDKALTRLFNECVMCVWAFRDIHVTFSALYIGRYTSKETATGGTPYKVYLRKHRDESQAHQLTDHGEECMVRMAVPTFEAFQAELDTVLKPETRNGIPPHLMARHADIIARWGGGSPSLHTKSFPTGAEWVHHDAAAAPAATETA